MRLRLNPDSGKKSVRIKDKDLKALHEKRMRHILDIAKKEKEDVVILGALDVEHFQIHRMLFQKRWR